MTVKTAAFNSSSINQKRWDKLYLFFKCKRWYSLSRVILTLCFLIGIHNVCFSQPNLKFTSVNVSNSLYRGLTYPISVTIKNSGTSAIPASLTGFAINLSINSATTYNGNQIFLWGTTVYSAIGVNQTLTLTGNITIPCGYATGTKYIITAVDALNQIAESDETDNNYVALSSLVLTLPELVPTPSSFSLTSTSIAAGGTTTANFGVTNWGGTAATSFNVGFYLSPSTTLSTSAPYLNGFPISSLASCTPISSLSKTLTIPSNTCSGTYYLFMWVDDNLSISESDESDNFSYIPITVTASPPSTPTGLAVTAVGTSSTYLSWTNISGLSYDIYSCTGTLLASSVTSPYAFGSLSPNTTYSYKIRACNSCACSGYTSCVSATTASSVGSVNVTINPTCVNNLGATWSLDGSGAYTSGTTLNAVSAGSHTIGFNSVSGFTSPTSQIITVTTGNLSSVTGTYTQLPGNILTNGSFSASLGWNATGNFQIQTNVSPTFSKYRSPFGYGYLADFNGVKADNISGSIYQDFYIPSCNSGISVSFWYYITSDETNTTVQNDTCLVSLIDQNNIYPPITIARLTNLNKDTVYKIDSVVIPSIPTGQYWRLKFSAGNNSTFPTVFRIDDVNVSPILGGTNFSCISWQNGIHPVGMVDSAMNTLCNYSIISSSQDTNSLSSPIPQIEVARCLGKALLRGDTAQVALMDNFPNIYPGLDAFNLTDQRYIKLMMYLEYQSKGPSVGTDNISPFSREYFFPIKKFIQKSDAIKTLLEAWNITPFMGNYDPASFSNSPLFCDVQKSAKNLGWLEQAQIRNLISGIITTPCGGSTSAFGTDGNMSYKEFYVVLARLMSTTPLSNVDPNYFFAPNLFRFDNLNSNQGLQKGVFEEFAGNGFNIPSGGLGLQFQYSYHSNLAEIPMLNKDTDVQKTYLKPKLQPLGTGWTHTYSAFIKSLTDSIGKAPGRILIYWPDGTIQSYLVQQGKYETKGITDKLTIDSTNLNQPSKVTIKKGRTVFTFRNIDNPEFSVLSLVLVTDAYGNTLNLDYASGYAPISALAPKLLSKVTDSYSGRFLLFNYGNTSNLLQSVTDPINRQLHFYVSGINNDLDSAADAKNQTTRYSYNEEVGTTAYRTHLLERITKPKGNVISNTYFNGKLSKTTGEGYVTIVSAVPMPLYRGLSPVLNSEITKTTGTQVPITTSNAFDLRGNLQSITSPTTSIQTIIDSATNRVILERDLHLGFIKKYSYDTSGYISKEVVIDSLFSDSTIVQYTHNQFGELTLIQDFNDPNTGSTGTETKFYLTSQGKPDTIVTNEGAAEEVHHYFTYNQSGLLTEYTSPAGFHTLYTYNTFGNPITVKKQPVPSSANVYLTETFAYDNVSRQTGHADAEGNLTTHSYDNNDNTITETKDPSGLNLITQVAYDANDNPISVTSPKGHVTTLSYDNVDNLIEENDGTDKKKWRYNQDGTLDSFITKNNFVFKNTYYDQSLFPGTKLDGLLFSDGRTTFSYRDSSKQLYHINNQNGKGNIFFYDTNKQRSKWNIPDQVSGENFFSSGIPDAVSYGYDNLKRQTYCAAMNIWNAKYNYSYQYDVGLKSLSNVQNTNTHKIMASYKYQNDGQILSTTYGNGDSIFYHRDKYNRLDSISAKNANGQLLYSIAATLDNNGRHTSETLKIIYQGQVDTTLPGFPSLTSTYNYQTRNRIISGDGRSYFSDNAGNVDSITGPPNSYSWSEYGQLTGVSKNGNHRVYDYDPLGFRRKKDTAYFVVDQQITGNVILDAKQSGIPINAYVYGNGLICRIDPATDSEFYYHYDFRGSVIAITNQSGQLVQLYKYDPYGRVYAKKGSLTWNNSYQYLGKHGVQTDDSDLYFCKARYYQPSTGRFLSEDPLWNTNLFVYGDDDPINMIDPLGNKAQQYCDAVTGLPDFDGALTFQEAKNWYQNGNGMPLNVNINSLDLSGVHPEDFVNGVGSYQSFNLQFSDNPFSQTGKVYGHITLRLHENNTVKAFPDTYNFEMHPWKDIRNWPRNFGTLGGRVINGSGTPFQININGTATIEPSAALHTNLYQYVGH